MANRKDFYFRERVTESELDSAFADLEDADHHLAGDLGFVGVLANAVASQHAPVPDLTVDVSGPGIVFDQLGQRIFFSALQTVTVAQDDNGVSTEVSADGKERIVSVFVKFDRVLSDPRIDGNSATVFFRRDEGFKFSVVQGAEAAAGAAEPPALRADAILLADVVRRFGQAQVTTDAISVARRQDALVVPGAPRGLRRGRTLEIAADLLGFYNAHVGGTSDRHPAASIDFGGGRAWADGTLNPAATVEQQLDKLVTDLAAAGGAAKIGTAAAAGVPNALAAGTLQSQLAALLGALNGHATAKAGAHIAAAVTYAAGGAWKDGTANPATTVQAQLDKLVADLAADAGAARLGIGARTTWIDGRPNPAGGSLFAALDKIVTDLNDQGAGADGAGRIGAQASGTLPAGSVRSQLDALNASAVHTNAPNVFTVTQTFNGTDDVRLPALATTTSLPDPTSVRLLWEIAGFATIYKYRFYITAESLLITANARWDGTQWVSDNTKLPCAKLDFSPFALRISQNVAGAPPFSDGLLDENWPNTVAFDPKGKQTLDAGGNWTSPGPTESYAAWQGQVGGGQVVGTGAPFRKQFPATPSSITFLVQAGTGIGSGPFAFSPQPAGTGVAITASANGGNCSFAAHVFAS